MLAGLAFLGLAMAGSRLRGVKLYLGLAASMVLFLNAARLAAERFAERLGKVHASPLPHA